MAKLGRILRLTKRGLVLRAERAPKLGVPVFGGERRIGDVADIFGPVGNPYVIVKPASGLGQGDLQALVGKELHIIMGEERGRKA